MIMSLTGWATTYYIDSTNGNDTNNGLTISTAWQTIAKINASNFNPGDQILFKKGEIWREQLQVQSSGLPGNRILFSAYGEGDKPIIKGTDINGHIRRDYCIYSDNQADYITIDCLELGWCGNAAIFSSENDGWIIRSCTIRECGRRGIWGRGNPTGEGSAKEWIVERNIIGRINCPPSCKIQRSGISLCGMIAAIIRKNSVATINSYGIALDSGGDKGKGAASLLNEIYSNDIDSCQTGIALYNSDSCKVFRNYIHDSSGSGILVVSGSDFAEIYYNVINNLSVSYYRQNFNGIDINWNSHNGKIYNNTVRKVAYVSCTIEDLGGTCNGWLIKNNILDARENSPGDVPIQVYSSITDITISNNDYVCNQTEPYFYDKVGRWKRIYSTFEKWNTLSGDTGSISATPHYLDYENGNFQLKNSSPCINKGTNVGLKQDYDGNIVPSGTREDIGAYEYQFIVPVELSSFEVIVENDHAILHWITRSETNNFGFEIERKKQNDSEFRQIGFVAGKGTTTLPQSYYFSDLKLLAGTYYYRLKQIDCNGSFEFSNVKSIVVGSPLNFELEMNYPNPFNSATTITYRLADSRNVVIRIFNLPGEEICTLVEEKQEAGYHKVNWNGKDKFGNEIPSGIFILSVKAGDFYKSQKIVKIK